MERRDAVVVGAGHNGLACAALLARAGLDVLALERRGVPGGRVLPEREPPEWAAVGAVLGALALGPPPGPDGIRAEARRRGVEQLVERFARSSLEARVGLPGGAIHHLPHDPAHMARRAPARGPRSGASTSAARARIRAGRSPARRASTPPGWCSPTSRSPARRPSSSRDQAGA